jgi:nucleoside-diphosphate-sugar epimerase
VTGATGKAGRAAVRELREREYDVVATDAVVGPGEPRGAVLRADLTDYGQATEVLRGTDAVVHLANIPAPGLAPPAITFNAARSGGAATRRDRRKPKLAGGPAQPKFGGRRSRKARTPSA